MSERVLVTGGAGYVGRQVVHHLLEHGKRVTTLDRNNRCGDTPWIRVDLADRAALEAALKDHSFDWVIHLASLPGDTGDPARMTDVNINGCANLLEYCRKTGVARFLLASSISAHGWYPGTPFERPQYFPVDEAHPCRPKDMYSTTKRVQELLTLTYFHQYKLPVTVLRLTAVIGPRGSGGGRAWRQFAEQLAEGRCVQIPHFSAEELCHYVDARDVARMFLTAAEHPAAVGEIFNCVSLSPTRGSDFVDVVRRLFPGIAVEFGFPWSMAQGGEISFDMSKAKRLMDFQPIYTLADSVDSIRRWIDAGGLKEQAAARTYQAGVAKVS